MGSKTTLRYFVNKSACLLKEEAFCRKSIPLSMTHNVNYTDLQLPSQFQRPAEMVVRSFVPNCMITTLGANSSTTPKSYSLVLETVLPPVPCHLMSRSPSRLKFFAMCALKLRQRKSCTRRMKEWPRIKTRIGGMRKREYNQRKYLPEKILLEI